MLAEHHRIITRRFGIEHRIPMIPIAEAARQIELPLHLNFMAFAIPGAIAALAMTVFVLNERRNRVAFPTAQAL